MRVTLNRVETTWQAESVGKTWCWLYGQVVDDDRTVEGLFDHYDPDPEKRCPGPHGELYAAVRD
jgi:hypothetical protein